MIYISVTTSHLEAVLYHAIYSPDLYPYAIIAKDDLNILYDIDISSLIASAPKDFTTLQINIQY